MLQSDAGLPAALADLFRLQNPTLNLRQQSAKENDTRNSTLGAQRYSRTTSPGCHAGPPAPGRPVRRHHDCYGRHYWRRHFYQPLRGGAAVAHSGADPGRVDRGRSRGHPRGVHLRGVGFSHAEGRRPICLSPRGVPSCRGIPLRMGPAAGHRGRRHGRGHGDLCAISAGADRMAAWRSVRLLSSRWLL